MTNQRYRVFIYADNAVNDMFFTSTIKNGMATYKGKTYLVKLASDAKRYYGVNHGPSITRDATLKNIDDYLLRR